MHTVDKVAENTETKDITQLTFRNVHLNASQQKAVAAVVQNESITIIHGPPGTGKTTTLIEAIVQLIKRRKVLVAAPSNTAVDNIAKGLLKQNISLLRVGNSGKADEALFAHTPEGKLSSSKHQKEVKIKNKGGGV